MPYNILPLIEHLKAGNPDPDGHILNRLAIAHPDRADLAMQVSDFATRFRGFYPPPALPATPDTDTTIDRFLNSYGTSSQKEIDALTAAIFNPMPDYADVLAAQEGETPSAQAPADSQDQLIDKFIAQSQQREQEVISAATTPVIDDEEISSIATTHIGTPEHNDPSTFTESLAKYYIKQHKYAKALEIINNINLNFPEKSIYFADQIRFLKKLVLNEKFLNKE